MKKFIGVKVIQAEPMNKGTFDNIGVVAKDAKDPKGTDEGYHVTYEDGYTSWSPKDVFEKAYIELAEPKIEYGVLEAYQLRVVVEFNELMVKVKALGSFVYSKAKFEKIDEGEQVRLSNQLSAMQYYAMILAERINNF